MRVLKQRLILLPNALQHVNIAVDKQKVNITFSPIEDIFNRVHLHLITYIAQWTYKPPPTATQPATSTRPSSTKIVAHPLIITSVNLIPHEMILCREYRDNQIKLFKINQIIVRMIEWRVSGDRDARFRNKRYMSVIAHKVSVIWNIVVVTCVLISCVLLGCVVRYVSKRRISFWRIIKFNYHNLLLIVLVI